MQHARKNIQWLDKDRLVITAIKAIQYTEIALDIGSGIMPQNYVTPVIHICVEPFDQYVRYLHKKICTSFDRQYIIIKASWEEVLDLFPEKSVDTIFLIDVIEHIEKKVAIRLLKESEKIVRKQIVIFTPLGFVSQHHSDGKDAWGLDGGKWQEHKSGWEPQDFDNSWNIYVTKKFHFTDNLGKKLKKPFGAFFAIKNMSFSKKKSDNYFRNKKNIIFQIYRQTILLNNVYLLRFLLRFLTLVNKIKN